MRTKLLKLIVSCLIGVSILMPLASCDRYLSNGISFQNEITSQEIVRLIVDAIDNPDNCADSYASIPVSQRPDVNYSYYYEYISIMRTISQQRGRVQSFRMLTDEEVADYTADSIVSDNSDYEGLIGAELLYADNSSNPVYLFLMSDDNGRAYLSSKWVYDIISIYNYAEHYFSIMEEQNMYGLYTLLRPGLLEGEYSDNAVYARASYISEFYLMKVKSRRSQYVVDVFLPDQIKITIPEVFSEDGLSIESHTVTIRERSDNNFYIIDDIPFVPDSGLVNMYQNGSKLLTCGAIYSYDFIVSLLGDPMYVSYYELSEEEMNQFSEYNTKAIVNYSGLLLVFYFDNTDSSSSWSGELISIKVHSNDNFQLGTQIYPGITRSELLEIYPFIELTDFNFTVNYLSMTYNVSISFDEDDVIDYVRVSVA